MPTTDYKARLHKNLKVIKYAAGYLTAAFEEGEDVFLLALHDVVQARKSAATHTKVNQLNRENLLETLSKRRNLRLKNIAIILDNLGLEVIFKPKTRRTIVG